jgi:hypothetical protein
MIDHAPSPDRLRQLATTLRSIDLTVSGELAESQRRRTVAMAGDYLAPRLSDPSDTIVVAVVGPGGGGKSTIVNSIARRLISAAGPIRPTTLEPVAWTDGQVPLTLDALRAEIPGGLVDSLRPPPEGVVLVDTPPPEVFDAAGTPVAHRIIDVADAVLFVAGASRYADADAVSMLELAAGRGLPTVMVLNRVSGSPEAEQLVALDFAQKLAERRLLPRADAELVVTVPEAPIDSTTGALAPETVARIVKELEAMADPQSRPDVIEAAVSGSLRRLRRDLGAIRGHVIDAAVRRVELLDPMQAAYRHEAARLVADARSGRFAATDGDALIDGLASAATRRAGVAARAAAEVWHEAAAGLIERSPDLFEHGPETLATARERLSFWLADLEQLPSRMAGKRFGRRARRRLAAAARLSAVDPSFEPKGRTRRRLARIPGLVASAQDRLADELRGILETDARRFTERLGPAVSGSTFGSLTTGALL